MANPRPRRTGPSQEVMSETMLTPAALLRQPPGLMREGEGLT